VRVRILFERVEYVRRVAVQLVVTLWRARFAKLGGRGNGKVRTSRHAHVRAMLAGVVGRLSDMAGEQVGRADFEAAFRGAVGGDRSVVIGIVRRGFRKKRPSVAGVGNRSFHTFVGSDGDVVGSVAVARRFVRAHPQRERAEVRRFFGGRRNDRSGRKQLRRGSAHRRVA